MNTMVQEPVRTFPESEERSRTKLKLVTAIIRPEQLGAVTEALNQLNLVSGFTVSDARGSGRESIQTHYFRGTPYVIRLAPELRIEIVVPEDRINEIGGAIQQNARTGRAGDGKIWVTDVTTVTRIRTGERDLAAL